MRKKEGGIKRRCLGLRKKNYAGRGHRKSTEVHLGPLKKRNQGFFNGKRELTNPSTRGPAAALRDHLSAKKQKYMKGRKLPNRPGARGRKNLTSGGKPRSEAKKKKIGGSKGRGGKCGVGKKRSVTPEEPLIRSRGKQKDSWETKKGVGEDQGRGGGGGLRQPSHVCGDHSKKKKKSHW